MTQSQPFRSASLCHRYWSCAPTTWSMTQPQSRSDQVPGNTTTPNFNVSMTLRKAIAGSPRNRRFRGVRRPRPRTSPSGSFLGMELEAEVFDHVVGEQPVAHLLDPLARVALIGGVEGHLDVLADPHVVDLAESKRCQALLDGDPLRVVDDRLRSHDHVRGRLHLYSSF